MLRSKLSIAAVAGLLLLIGLAAVAYLQPFPPLGYGDRREDEVFRDCETCPQMIPIAGGETVVGGQPRRDYWMSALGFDVPRRLATVPAFAIGRFEVTFAEWDACVADGGCDGYVPTDEGWGRDDRPVLHVSWNDAQSYVRWLSEKTGERYRLPSEAEWEHAARAGAHTWYPWGKRASHDYANYGEPECPPCTGAVEGRDRWLNTAPVGQFPPNRFGVFDTSGNVYEWVQDCFVADLPKEAIGPEPVRDAVCDRHPMKGAAWYSDPGRVSSYYRAFNASDRRDPVIGFRVARDL